MKNDQPSTAIRFVAPELRASDGLARSSADYRWRLFESTIEEAVSVLRESCERNRELKEKLEHSERRIADAESRLTEFESRVAAETDKLRVVVDRQSHELAEVKLHFEAAKEEIARFAESHAGANEEAERLRNEARDFEQKMALLAQDRSSAVEERDRLRSQFETESAEKDRTIHAQQTDLQNALRRLEDAERRCLESESRYRMNAGDFERIREECEELKSRVTELGRGQKAREVEIETLTAELRIRREQVSTLSGRLEPMEEELARVRKEQVSLIEQRDSVTKSLHSVREVQQQAEYRIGLLSDERDRLSAQLSEAVSKFEASEARVREAQASMAALEQLIQGSQQFFEAVTPRIQILKEEIKLIRSETTEK